MSPWKPITQERDLVLTLRGAHIARTFPLAKVQDAHRYMESDEQLGKIVMTV